MHDAEKRYGTFNRYAALKSLRPASTWARHTPRGIKEGSTQMEAMEERRVIVLVGQQESYSLLFTRRWPYLKYQGATILCDQPRVGLGELDIVFK